MEAKSFLSLLMAAQILTLFTITVNAHGQLSNVAKINRLRRETPSETQEASNADASQSDPSQDSGNHGNMDHQSQGTVEHHSDGSINDQQMPYSEGASYHDNQQPTEEGAVVEGDTSGSQDLGSDHQPSSSDSSSHDVGASDHQPSSSDSSSHDAGASDHQTYTDHNSGTDHSPQEGHQDSGNNPLIMSRPGELPPIALPLTLEGADLPQALSLKQAENVHDGSMSHGDPLPTDGAHSDPSIHQDHNPEQVSADMQGHTDGHTNVAYQTGGGETHTQDSHQMAGFHPRALPLTGGSEMGFQRRVQPRSEGHEMAPVALAQRQGSTAAPSNSRRPPPNWGSNQAPGRSGAKLPRARPTWRAPGTQSGARGQQGGTGSQPLDAVQMIQQMHAVDRMGDHVDSAIDRAGDILKATHGLTGNHMLNQGMNPRFNTQGGTTNPGDRFPTNQQFGSSQPGSQPFYKNPYSGAYPQYPPYYRFGDRPDRPEYKPYGYQGYEGYGGYPGYDVENRRGYPPCTNMSDPYCKMMQQQAMMGGDGYAGYPPCTNMSDPYCKMMQQQAMMGGDGYGREIQLEGPHGEMDIEPGELDIEGPIAHGLLKRLGLGGANMNPMQQEITLNTHILNALQSRFGINTTQGVQRMSANPEFQAFMYRVLTHSAPVAPGEYNANLNKTEVNSLLNGLGQSNFFNRLATANLNHAQINTSASDPSQKVLTIDGGPAPNPIYSQTQLQANNEWTPMQNLPPMSAILPGFALPQSQETAATGQGTATEQGTATKQGAAPGRVEALVQTRGEGAGEGAEGAGRGEAGESKGKGGEAGEAAEGKKGAKTEGSEKGTNVTGANMTDIQGTNSSATAKLTSGNEISSTAVTEGQGQLPVAANEGGITQQGPIVIKSQMSIKNGKIVNKQPLTAADPAQGAGNTATGEADIVGKDSKPGLSKDQRTAAAKTEAAGTQGQGHGTGSGPHRGAGNGAGQGAGLGASQGAGHETVKGTGTGGVPAGSIAMQEAGIISGAGTGAHNETNAVPIEHKLKKYKASTVFAVISIVLIACAIILGPIVCMLCKMKERRDDKARKLKALKNKDVSDNSIMEAMMLHEFGPDGPNTVANDGAADMGNVYQDTVESRYVTIDPEMERMNRRHLP